MNRKKSNEIISLNSKINSPLFLANLSIQKKKSLTNNKLSFDELL